jgi:hypothetical protein
MKQETVNGTIIIPYWKSAPYWPLIYTNIAGVCTFEKFVVDSKIMSSKIIKRGRGRNGMFGKTQSECIYTCRTWTPIFGIEYLTFCIVI